MSGERESSLADPHGGPVATEKKYELSLFSFFAKMAHESAKISIIAKLDFRRKNENFAFRENKVNTIK